ncbi:MAG: adenylyltransferase/cytidyltransferase family protein [Clostridia bacterium]|nr:adenylyltransferase/cytidyltransferase family protein [Clostridia bacterium]
MKKIGIYGGSFDPVHKGHRLLAENLSKEINADKVFIIPAAVIFFILMKI